ncbi:hypothetical protein O3P69_010000 [Scylla paramamosain]|uniref:Uncharacterized protein n=1 Tax=Scylla paramamosain TaxID=85552 RepID=A0AAW0SNQ2_SCYPA
MASSRHPRFSPSGSRQARARLPARPPLSMEDAFTLLQAGMASLSTARQARDATFGGQCERDHAVAGAEVTADDVTEEPLVASYRQRGPKPRRPVCAPESSGQPTSGWHTRPHQNTAFQSGGSCLPSHTTVQDVHFVENVERLYLSFTTCKDLGLIHQDFPNPSAVTAGVGVTDGDAHDVPGRPAAIPMQPLEENVPQLEQSPAQLATGRQLRDGLPSVKRKLEVDNFGRRTLRQRERQMADHHNRVVADRNVTRSRAPLAPGDRVLPGPPARQEMEQSRLDGSGRISLRTRQHLRPAPEVPQASDTEDLAPPPTPLPPLSPPSPAPRMDGEGRRARRPPRWLKDYVQ